MTIRTILPRALAAGAVASAMMLGCRDREMPTSPRITAGAGAPSYVFSSATPIVNTLFDDGDGTCTTTKCTLRDALAFVDTGGTIGFSVTGTIHLAAGELQIDRNVTIDGPGRTLLVLSGDSTSRVVYITSGITVVIQELTIANGLDANYGGGVYSDGNLTIDDVTVTGCFAQGGTAVHGGGLYNNGRLWVLNSFVTNNAARGGSEQYGGGIYSADSLVISNSVISGNIAGSVGASGGTGYGGGVYAWGPLTISASTFEADTSYNGGGLTTFYHSALITGSTFSGNRGGDGGAIYSEMHNDFTTSVTTIVNSTLSGNMAVRGGGVAAYNGLTRIVLSTLTNNTSTDTAGGGIFSYSDDITRAQVKSSIIVGNAGTDVYAFSTLHPIESGGYNVIGSGGGQVDFTRDFTDSTDTTGVTSAGLGPLALNTPGTTRTHELLTGSVAINTGSCLDLDSATVTEDQRGLTRPQGIGCDAGAYERSMAFTSSCTYMVNAKNGSLGVHVEWANASPGVTQVLVSNGRIVQKSMAPSASGSVDVRVREGTPTYEIRAGATRRQTSTILVPAGTACDAASP